MGKVKNILFIMCDQLRCRLPVVRRPSASQDPGHRRPGRPRACCSRAPMRCRALLRSLAHELLHRPLHVLAWCHLELRTVVPPAKRPSVIICGRPGIRVALAGKTHVLPDLDGLERYGIEGGSAIAALMRAGRFEELDRYDGHSPPGEESGCAAYLRKQGYNSDDPWSDYVISADGPDGPVSGWQMRNVRLPARVAEEHSETAYMTREAMRFCRGHGREPWFLHLQLRQAALALHGARALSQDVRAPRIACRSIATSASWSPSIPCSRPIASMRNRSRSSAPMRLTSCGRPTWA